MLIAPCNGPYFVMTIYSEQGSEFVVGAQDCERREENKNGL